MAIEIKVPVLGESIAEAEVAEWLLSPGDPVEVDQPVVVLETDKANLEVPAPSSGTLGELRKAVGDLVRVGEVLASIDDSPGRPESWPETDSEPRVTPAARRLLADLGVKAEAVRATGPGSRLSKEDVLRHAEAAPTGEGAPDSAARRVRRVPMTLLRRRVAQRLVEAQQAAALLTTFNEVDMTAILAARQQYREAFQQAHGVNLGFMSFFVKASLEGLKAFPELNASIEGDTILYHDYFDIGVAVGASKGLVVPVLRNAEQLSFAEVEKAIADLAERARTNRLGVEELRGGTFTISNGGVFGSLLSTPIVNPPQSGVLGVHKIQDRPVAVEGRVEVRPMMYLALTYDHRLVDGREAVSFLVRVKDCLENPVRVLLEV